MASLKGTANGGTYTIGRGDTLGAIAKNYGTTVSALAKANGISNPNTIRAGSTITIPGGGIGNAMAYGGGGSYGGAAAAGTAYPQQNGRVYAGTSLYNTYAPPTDMPHGGHHGYLGPIYQDAKGRKYTDYGAYLRDDNFYYPEGAKISPNGMYYDDGSGWKFANYAVAMDKYTGEKWSVPGDSYGVSPGSRLELGFDFSGDGGSGYGAGGYDTGGSVNAGNGGNTGTDAEATPPTQEQINAYLDLLDYSYRNPLNDDWIDYVKNERGW